MSFFKYKFAEVTAHSTRKRNKECLIYFICLFHGPNQSEKCKGSNIIVCNFPRKFFYIESKIWQWKDNIEYLIFLPPPTSLYH